MEEKRIKEGGRTVNTLVFARTCSFWKSLRERFRCKNLRENAFARLRSVKVVPSLWERGSLICPQSPPTRLPSFSNADQRFHQRLLHIRRQQIILNGLISSRFQPGWSPIRRRHHGASRKETQLWSRFFFRRGCSSMQGAKARQTSNA
jgi:hypothetical protein